MNHRLNTGDVRAQRVGGHEAATIRRALPSCLRRDPASKVCRFGRATRCCRAPLSPRSPSPKNLFLCI